MYPVGANGRGMPRIVINGKENEITTVRIVKTISWMCFMAELYVKEREKQGQIHLRYRHEKPIETTITN